MYLNPHRLLHGVLQSANGTLIFDGMPPYMKTAVEKFEAVVKKDTEAKQLHDLQAETLRLQRESHDAEMQALNAMLARQRVSQVNNFYATIIGMNATSSWNSGF